MILSGQISITYIKNGESFPWYKIKRITLYLIEILYILDHNYYSNRNNTQCSEYIWVLVKTGPCGNLPSDIGHPIKSKYQ